MQQKDFLRKIEDILPANTSLMSELSDILNLSQDSAYRRIRGETQLTLTDISLLCKHYKISFDVFDDMDINNVTFSFLNIDYDYKSFELYLRTMLKDLDLIKNAKYNKIIYACEDIPIFYNYKYPMLGAFKIFYWMEAILNKDSINNNKFGKDSVPKQLTGLGTKVFDSYLDIPSVEIWTETTYLSVLRQIEFFWESGKFENEKIVLEVLSDLGKLLNDIQLQAEVGKKLFTNTTETGQRADYELYLSDMQIGNNSVLIDLGTTKSVYMGHMSFNTISTMNTKYCDMTEQWLENIIKKANPVSKFSEKLRFQFFRKAFRKIIELKNRIEES
jgi:hypothetical protein